MTIPTTRRTFLKTTLTTAAALAGGALAAGPARAQKAPKATVNYIEKPKGDQKCANCMFFTPGKDGQAGACQLVQGEIGADHWCMIWAVK